MPKTCKKCITEKPLSEFSKMKASPDGHQTVCKACQKAYHAQPDQVAKRRAKQEAVRTDPELLARERKRSKKRYERLYANPEHREKKRVQKRQRYAADPEATKKSREAAQAFRASPEGQAWSAEYDQKPHVRAIKKASNNAQWYKRYAEEKGAEGSYGARDVIDVFEAQGGRCYYCGCELDETWQVDHYIPITRGGSNWPSNIVATCSPCNRTKYNKLPWEFDPSIPETRLEPRP